jgi:hypothetical protein
MKAVKENDLKAKFTSTKEYFSVRYALMPRTGTPVKFPAGADLDTIFERLEQGAPTIDFGRPEFYKSAKLWDCINWLSPAPYATVLFLSSKAHALFSKFNLGEHRFYPFKALHQNKEYDYYCLRIQSDETTQVNFPLSTFYVEDENSDDLLDPDCYPLKFDSQDACVEYNNTKGDKGTYSVNVVHALELHMQKSFDKSLDMFTFADILRKIVISNRLRLAIEQEKLTGFDINEVCIRT